MPYPIACRVAPNRAAVSVSNGFKRRQTTKNPLRHKHAHRSAHSAADGICADKSVAGMKVPPPIRCAQGGVFGDRSLHLDLIARDVFLKK